jgi:hypothetical protein
LVGRRIDDVPEIEKVGTFNAATARRALTGTMLWNKEMVAFALLGAAIIVALMVTLLYLEQHLPKAHDGNWWIFLVFWALVFVSLHVIFYVIIKAFRWFTRRELKPKKLYISPGGDWWLGDSDSTFDEPVHIALPADFDVEEFQSCTPPPLSVFRGMYRSEIFDNRLFDVMNTDAKNKRQANSNGASPRVLFIAPSGQYWFGDPVADDAVAIHVPGTFAVSQFYSKEVFIGMYKTKQLDKELFPDVPAGAEEEDDVVAGEGELVDADDNDEEDDEEDDGLVARGGPTTRSRGGRK